MTLRDEILKLEPEWDYDGHHYPSGFEDGIKAAAELAINADAEIDRLRNALSKIASWELPETGKYWQDDKRYPVSYEAEHGSVGAQRYIQNLAIEALKK